MSRSFKLTIAYDGTEFAGWQVQPGKPTIQGSLQDAFVALTGQKVQVVGSGRTDSGVHAIAQVASCHLHWRDEATRLVRALNCHLPDTIAVTDAEDAKPGFHAIRDSIKKRYRYQLQVGGVRDPFEHRYRWHLHRPLNLKAMRDAASHIVGRHDFRSFQAAGSDRKTTVREVTVCDIREEQQSRCQGIHLAIEVEADGFLYNMVRNIVGTLVEIGRGKQPAKWVEAVLAARDRDLAGPTAPSHGLFLASVTYPDACTTGGLPEGSGGCHTRE